jgi:hypothetical protein
MAAGGAALGRAADRGLVADHLAERTRGAGPGRALRGQHDQRGGQEIKNDLDDADAVVRSASGMFAASYASGQRDRATYMAVLKPVASASKTMLGGWLMFAPGALGDDAAVAGKAELGSTPQGRFVGYWVRDGERPDRRAGRGRRVQRGLLHHQLQERPAGDPGALFRQRHRRRRAENGADDLDHLSGDRRRPHGRGDGRRPGPGRHRRAADGPAALRRRPRHAGLARRPVGQPPRRGPADEGLCRSGPGPDQGGDGRRQAGRDRGREDRRPQGRAPGGAGAPGLGRDLGHGGGRHRGRPAGPGPQAGHGPGDRRPGAAGRRPVRAGRGLAPADRQAAAGPARRGRRPGRAPL